MNRGKSTTLIFLTVSAVALVALILMPTGAQAEDEINKLRVKKARLTQEQEEIDQKAEPLGQQLFQVLAELKNVVAEFNSHEQKVEIHNSKCDRQFSADEEAAYNSCIDRYNALEQEKQSIENRRRELNNAVKSYKDQLQSYKDRWDELEGLKNQIQAEIDISQVPVDARELLATTGKGFEYGQDLLDYIQKADWSMRAKSAFILGILKANRGQYNEVINYLEDAVATAPNEPLLKKALANAKDLKAAKKAKASAGPLAQETVNPDDLAHFPIKVQAEVNLATASLVVGDYDAAVKYMNEALETLPDDQGLLDGLLYVKQLKAAQDERVAGSADPDLYRAVRVRAKGEAAWKLGLYLSEKSDYEATVRYLKEARSLIQDDLSTQLIDKLITDVRKIAPGPIEGMPIYPSKADAILDALEYGKGDWGASLRYLEAAHNSDPSNLPVRDALNYLQGLYND